MISLAVFCVIVAFYFWYGESDTSAKEACVAILIYIAYTILYLFVPPFPIGTSSQMGQLYGLVPLLSFGAILFPHFNTQSPELITRKIGWFGLVIVAIILTCFKVFVW